MTAFYFHCESCKYFHQVNRKSCFPIGVTLTSVTILEAVISRTLSRLVYAKSLESEDIVSGLVLGFALIFQLVSYLILATCFYSKLNILLYYILLMWISCRAGLLKGYLSHCLICDLRCYHNHGTLEKQSNIKEGASIS